VKSAIAFLSTVVVAPPRTILAQLLLFGPYEPTIFIINGHILPHFILVQPDGIRVSSDELVDVLPLALLRARNTFLFPVNENRHVFFFPLAPRLSFGGCRFEFSL